MGHMLLIGVHLIGGRLIDVRLIGLRLAGMRLIVVRLTGLCLIGVYLIGVYLIGRASHKYVSYRQCLTSSVSQVCGSQACSFIQDAPPTR
jgi:hypothetical protein